MTEPNDTEISETSEIRVEIDRAILRQVAPEGVEFSAEVEERILQQLNEQILEILTVIQPICSEKVGTTLLRRLLALNGYKICF